MNKLNYILMFCLCLFSCNLTYSQQWGEVTSIGNIEQGNILRLEPIEDTVLVLSGSKMSVTNINFKCIILKGNSEIKYQSALTIPASFSTGVSSFETSRIGGLEEWPSDVKEKNIKIPIIILPTFHKYEGEGNIYLYLIDSTENCISNIIAWKIKFK